MTYTRTFLYSSFLPAILLSNWGSGFAGSASGQPSLDAPRPESVAYERFRLNVVQGVATMEAQPSGNLVTTLLRPGHSLLQRPIWLNRAVLTESGSELIEKQTFAQHDYRNLDGLRDPVGIGGRATLIPRASIGETLAQQ